MSGMVKDIKVKIIVITRWEKGLTNMRHHWIIFKGQGQWTRVDTLLYNEWFKITHFFNIKIHSSFDT